MSLIRFVGFTFLGRMQFQQRVRDETVFLHTIGRGETSLCSRCNAAGGVTHLLGSCFAHQRQRLVIKDAFRITTGQRFTLSHLIGPRNSVHVCRHETRFLVDPREIDPLEVL